MKANKTIIFLIVSMMLTSCLSKKYVISTHIERNGSLSRAISTIADSVSNLFPYDLSSGWEISLTDTAVIAYLSMKNTTIIRISKKFNSVDELPSGLIQDKIYPVPKEYLKKRFRWFYTYYHFTAVYPEISEKGQVAMEEYLNKDEQKLYFQGDMSAYKGLTGIELKEVLDGIEERFLEWYNRSSYEESFQMILQYTYVDYRPALEAAKDTLYKIYSKQNPDLSFMTAPNVKKLCPMIDEYFDTNRFSDIYAVNSQQIEDILQERSKYIDELLQYSIQFEISFLGKIIATNSVQQNNGALVWEVHLFKFLADDYTLTAEWRTANGWAFAITLLLIIFAVYCFYKASNAAG